MNNKRYFLYFLNYENRETIENVFNYGIAFDTMLSTKLFEIQKEFYEKDLDHSIDLVKKDDSKLVFYLEIPKVDFKKDEETKIFLPKTKKDTEGNIYIDNRYIKGVKRIKTGKHIINPEHIILEMPYGVERQISTKEEMNRFMMKNKKHLAEYTLLKLKLNKDLTTEYPDNKELIREFFASNKPYMNGNTCMFQAPKNVEEVIAENLDQSTIEELTQEKFDENITPSKEETVQKLTLKRKYK